MREDLHLEHAVMNLALISLLERWGEFPLEGSEVMYRYLQVKRAVIEDALRGEEELRRAVG